MKAKSWLCCTSCNLVFTVAAPSPPPIVPPPLPPPIPNPGASTPTASPSPPLATPQSAAPVEPLPSVKAQTETRLGCLLLAGGSVALFAVLLAFGFGFGSPVGWIVLVPGLVLLTAAWVVHSTAAEEAVCPHCGEWQAVECEPPRIVEQKKCHGLVVRQASSQYEGGSYGHERGVFGTG